jgi:hypothetical protein
VNLRPGPGSFHGQLSNGVENGQQRPGTYHAALAVEEDIFNFLRIVYNIEQRSESVTASTYQGARPLGAAFDLSRQRA